MVFLAMLTPAAAMRFVSAGWASVVCKFLFHAGHVAAKHGRLAVDVTVGNVSRRRPLSSLTSAMPWPNWP